MVLSEVLDGPLPHIIYYPSTYTGPEKKKYPTLLFLHGGGSVANPEAMKKISITSMLATGRIPGGHEKFPFIVIQPIAPKSGWPQHNGKIIELLEEVGPKIGVDPSRLYLTGQSMGGNGALMLALENPGRFAAVVPICSYLSAGVASTVKRFLGIGSSAFDKLRKRVAGSLSTTPVWAFHSADDALVSVEQSDGLVAAIKEAGNPEVKYTRYDTAPGIASLGRRGKGHACYELAYMEAELYTWLLRFTSANGGGTSNQEKEAGAEEEGKAGTGAEGKEEAA